MKISHLCEIAGISRSGYYNWLQSTEQRNRRASADATDFEAILEAYRYRGYDKGARGIHMRLLHTGIRMNVKKIRRLMKKFELFCPIRKANPYRRMAKAMKTSHVAPNLVNRKFTEKGARKILLTDISYLYYRGNVCYLSVIIDAFTRELLAYRVSESLEVAFVLNTVQDLIEKHGCEVDDSTIIHSDQGSHYTSNDFIAKLRDATFVQSMSRKGNCWDNAPQESFFGHMKDEIKAKVASCRSFAAVEAVLADWTEYYNNDRYQWELEKLSPREFYQYSISDIHPLANIPVGKTVKML